MNIQKLKSLYPNGKTHAIGEKFSDSQLNLLVENQMFSIDKKELSTSEIGLLQSMFEPISQPQNEWYSFLLGQTNAPKNTSFRIIHYQTSAQDSLETFLSDMLTGKLALFPIGEKEGIYIEKTHSASFSIEEYQEFFAALDNDLSAQTLVYVGNFYDTQSFQTDFFLSERDNFHYLSQHAQEKKVYTLSEVFLYKNLASSFNDVAMLSYLKSKLKAHPDYIELIQALWKNQGSLAQSAKDLYLHRNSLQYKIKKIEEEFAISLRNMDDLLLFYLLSIY